MAERDFVSEQDAEVRRFHDEFRQSTDSYVTAVESGCTSAERQDLLFACHRIGREYFLTVEREVLNCGNVSGGDYRRWREEWSKSARTVLNGVIRYHGRLRIERTKLALSPEIFEPADGAYYNIQAFFAARFKKKDVRAMRQKFVDAKLPFSGFDSPHMAKPKQNDHQWWRPLVSALIAVILIFSFVAGGQYVGYWTLIAIIAGVLAILVVISAVDLKSQGKITDKTFVETLGLAAKKIILLPFNKKPKD